MEMPVGLQELRPAAGGRHPWSTRPRRARGSPGRGHLARARTHPPPCLPGWAGDGRGWSARASSSWCHDLTRRVGTYAFRRIDSPVRTSQPPAVRQGGSSRTLGDGRRDDQRGARWSASIARDGLKLIFEGGAWVLIRLSGTEPEDPPLRRGPLRGGNPTPHAHDAPTALESEDVTMFDIEFVLGREVLDSRGNPTVEAEVVLSGGAIRDGPLFRRAPRPAPARPSSCATATPARYLARAWSGRWTTSTASSPEAVEGLDARDQLGVDQAMIRRRTAPTPRACSARTQFSPCHWPSPMPPPRPVGCPSTSTPLGGLRRPASSPVPMMEHPERRRPRRQLGGLPKSSWSCRSASPASRRRCAPASRSFHTLKKAPPPERGPRDRGRDEGGFAPNPAIEPGRARADHGGDREGRVLARADQHPAPSALDGACAVRGVLRRRHRYTPDRREWAGQRAPLPTT